MVATVSVGARRTVKTVSETRQTCPRYRLLIRPVVGPRRVSNLQGAHVYLTSPSGKHSVLVGGISVLERRVREMAKAGAARITVATDAMALVHAAPVPLTFVGGSAPLPDNVIVERGDTLRGRVAEDETTRREIEWQLIRGMNKSFEGPVDALINWRFSMRLTRWLSGFSLRVTPNHVTVLAILLGLFSGAMAAFGRQRLQGWGVTGWLLGYLPFALAGVGLQVNSILDSVDGELARLRFQYSKLGQWLDNLADDIVDNAFLVALGWGLWQIGSKWWFVLATFGASVRVLVSLITYFDVYRRTGTGDVFAFRWWFESDKSTADDVYDPTSPVTWLRSLGRRDTFVFLWMVACVVGLPQWVAVHGAVIGGVQVGLLVIHFTYGARQKARQSSTVA